MDKASSDLLLDIPSDLLLDSKASDQLQTLVLDQTHKLVCFLFFSPVFQSVWLYIQSHNSYYVRQINLCHVMCKNCAGVDNWSRLHIKLVLFCPDFTKDSESCRKKWNAIYNDYKEDKAMNLKSDSQRSKKCRWYHFVDDFMSDQAHVVSHAHASATNPDRPKPTTFSDTTTTTHKSGESTPKAPESKRNEDVF